MPDDIVAQAKFYLPVCNGYNMVVATEQHVNGNFTFFIIFQIFMLPVFQYIVSIVAAVSGHR